MVLTPEQIKHIEETDWKQFEIDNLITAIGETKKSLWKIKEELEKVLKDVERLLEYLEEMWGKEGKESLLEKLKEEIKERLEDLQEVYNKKEDYEYWYCLDCKKFIFGSEYKKHMEEGHSVLRFVEYETDDIYPAIEVFKWVLRRLEGVK